jgi:hypothetical protein
MGVVILYSFAVAPGPAAIMMMAMNTAQNQHLLGILIRRSSLVCRDDRVCCEVPALGQLVRKLNVAELWPEKLQMKCSADLL